MKDNCSTILSWFLPNIIINPPQVCLCHFLLVLKEVLKSTYSPASVGCRRPRLLISQQSQSLKKKENWGFLIFKFFCSSLHALTLCFPCKLWYTNIASLQNYKPPAGSTWLWELFSYFFSPPFIFISWRLITLQYCSGFCHTLTWISLGFPCVPHPDLPSRLPPHPIPLGLPSVPAPSTCLMHPNWAGDLFHPW